MGVGVDDHKKGMELSKSTTISKNSHPIELLARAYGLHPEQLGDQKQNTEDPK